MVGRCYGRVFGLAPHERLLRQIDENQRLRLNHGEPMMGVAMNACALLDEAALQWLFANPHQLLVAASGTPLAVGAPVEELGEARAQLERGGTGSKAGGRVFVRKLRRTVDMLAVSLDECDPRAIERRLYRNVYKGVTDVVTRYVWPAPAFHVVRFCAAVGISPNLVTFAGIVLMLAATLLFWQGEVAMGLAAGWAMTFLDTVDGKLARVTATSSRFGNLLDHGTDILHPPLWWWAVTVGLARQDSAAANALWLSVWVILATYVIGRVLEEVFKKRFGFNAYIWRRFDSRFRLIVSRRNILLLILTLGLAVGQPTVSWFVAAGWSIASVLVQGWRFLAAVQAARTAEVRPWLA